jgi:hypothetical protein
MTQSMGGKFIEYFLWATAQTPGPYIPSHVWPRLQPTWVLQTENSIDPVHILMVREHTWQRGLAASSTLWGSSYCTQRMIYHLYLFKELWNTITQLLTLNTSERPTLEHIMRNTWSGKMKVGTKSFHADTALTPGPYNPGFYIWPVLQLMWELWVSN